MFIKHFVTVKLKYYLEINNFFYVDYNEVLPNIHCFMLHQLVLQSEVSVFSQR